MSGSSSGSRFKPLPIEGEEDGSGSDSSAEEMNSDYFRKLSQEAGPSGIQSPHTGITSISGQRYVEPRSLRSGSKEEPSDLEFVWDHYRTQSKPIDEVGVDSLKNMFSQTSESPSHDVSNSKEDDIRILRESGFNIFEGAIGAGFYGLVYAGYYGAAAPKSDAFNRFAVKVIEFGQTSNESENLDRREKFETEKYILTNSFHPNIVSVRMIINMGDIQSFPFKDMLSKRYLSPERAYLIMDFADGGTLEGWLAKNHKHITVAVKIDLIRDLFAGMLYLHSENIVHGDVHTGNVLIFSKEDGVVAKWADFGLGYVGTNKQYTYRLPKTKNMSLWFRFDIQGMYHVYWSILYHRQDNEAPKEKQIMDEVLAMLEFMKYDKVRSLLDVYQQFKRVLEDELILDEQHYQ